jgi:hypothetical protein
MFGDVFTVISKTYLVCKMTQVKYFNKLGKVRVVKHFRSRALAKNSRYSLRLLVSLSA